MTKKTKRYYPREFKEQALEMLATGEYTVSGLEQELGITPGLVGDWRRKAERSGRYAPTSSVTDPKETAEQVKRLERQVVRLRQERDILKKRWPSLRLRSGRASATQTSEISIHRGTPC